MSTTAENHTYLGDGLYAYAEGGVIVVYASNGIKTANIVYFEPQVYMNFHSWVKAHFPELEKTR